MATPYHHSISSVNRWGGSVDDYLPLHNWFDDSKRHHGDFRHRALRHHAQGIFELESVFGVTITNSDGRAVPVRLIGEQHVTEDLGFIPSVGHWLSAIRVQPWMNRTQKTGGPVSEPLDPRTGKPPENEAA